MLITLAKLASTHSEVMQPMQIIRAIHLFCRAAHSSLPCSSLSNYIMYQPTEVNLMKKKIFDRKFLQVEVAAHPSVYCRGQGQPAETSHKIPRLFTCPCIQRLQVCACVFEEGVCFRERVRESKEERGGARERGRCCTCTPEWPKQKSSGGKDFGRMAGTSDV